MVIECRDLRTVLVIPAKHDQSVRIVFKEKHTQCTSIASIYPSILFLLTESGKKGHSN